MKLAKLIPNPLTNVHFFGVPDFRTSLHLTLTKLVFRKLCLLKKLQAIGCFCIGVNQVDLKSATQEGIVVFNAPYSNTRSVAELVIAAAVMLIRRIPDKNMAAHQGRWMKESKGSYELRGKTLGI